MIKTNEKFYKKIEKLKKLYEVFKKHPLKSFVTANIK